MLFAGAGLSLDAGLPNWSGLVTALRDRLSTSGHLPADIVPALDALLKHRERLPAVVDLILGVVPRPIVMRELREILTPTRPSSVAEALGRLNLRGAVTTNYDRILEPIFGTGKSYRLSNSAANLKMVPTAIASGEKFLLKLHGDLDDALDAADPTTVVNAIIRGHSGSFDLPDPIALVRSKAFGDRVAAREEERALQLALSGFDLVSQFDRARSAILARANLVEATRKASEAKKAAIGEISAGLSKEIARLQAALDEKRLALSEAEQALEESKDAPRRREHKRPKPKKRRK